MTDTLWKKALKNSNILQNYLKSEILEEELEQVTGETRISYLDSDSENNPGFLAIWMSMASMRRRISNTEEGLGQFEEDMDHLFQKIKSVENQVEQMNDRMYSQRAETAEYIRNLTERKFNAYQKLLEAQSSDVNQKEIAEELDMDEAVLSRFKKEFKQNNIL